MVTRQDTVAGRQVSVLAVLLLLVGVTASPYSPPLSEDSRLDQIKDFPEWYEVDPLTLGAREYSMECRWLDGVIGMPKKVKVMLEPTGAVRIVEPKSAGLFMGLWEPYTSIWKRTTTGMGLLFRRWKPNAKQDMEYVLFKMNFRPPVFQPCCMSFTTGEIVDELGYRLGAFKMRLPHNKPLVEPTFRAYRSWWKQAPW